MLSPVISEKEMLHVLCSASEFDTLKIRPEELSELDSLQQKHAFVKVKVATDDTAGKVNVLLQSFLSRGRIDSFTLQSDVKYIAQHAARVSRALFEISLKKG
jgi:replicative superfamily II helicase